MSAQTWREVGDGPLSRAAATVYTVLVVGFLLVLTTLPGLVPVLLLGRDASNLPLVALCLLPVGPAVSAALYALHHQRPDLTDLRPAARFRQGYRANLAQVLRIWVPLLLWLTVIAVNLTHLSVAGVPTGWAVPLLVIGVAVTLVGGNALVIASLFTFRTRDVLRLALYFLVRTPAVTIGTALLLAAAGALTVLVSEALPVLLAGPFVLAYLRITTPMTDLVRKDFTG
ncbi:DUF624 domain-containing protein [Micromonospora sp. HM134]|uniref:DUF624 domain-containing protein n=1 Tax=unclassified Micromonospora TaxID=2617518 RepID=UPI0011982D20|nr:MULTISPECIES: DUF624 domain-containing protein [unclassified Micromonospora]QDY08337.1 DUF624 domain-containing protein [Micromonospora sp. HM134]